MRTVDKGTIAELNCAARFSEAGYVVLFPSQICRYDLVVEKDGKFQRVQVKAAVLKDGAIVADLRTRGPNRSEEAYSEDQVDLIALWCPEIREMYVLSIKEARGKSIALRVAPPRNKQRKRIRFAENSRL